MQVRCPHCHNPIQLVEDACLSDIGCPSCGSSFNLIDETISHHKVHVRKLGHFELIEQVGMGAFGSVWKARDSELDRTVAVKIPRRGQLDSDETEQFLREARSAAQLSHPNIVSVHEVGREDGQIYIVSEYVEGVPLSSWLTANRPTFSEAAELTKEIADALQHAHEAGVIHRDLKPSNIMLDADGNPYIMDFGLAKRDAGEITMTVEGRVLGTPAYMSPEQARGESHTADGRTDIYSLGVILFELLTGERPFRGDYRMLLHQVIHDESPSPRKLIASIPRDLETICLKCLEKDAEKRFVTSSDLSEELGRFMRGLPIHSRPVGKVARGLRWCKRNPKVASLSCAVGVLLLFLGVSGPIVARREFNLRNDEAEARREAEGERNVALRATEDANAARNKTEATLARSDYFLALARWDANRAAEALNLLNRVPRGYRQFEWYLARNEFHGSGHILHGHTAPVFSAKFSPDGTRCVSGSADNTVRIWNASTGELIHTLSGHENVVNCVCFNPSGNQIASASEDQTVKVWDASSGELVRSIKSHRTPVLCVCYSPDGRLLASAGGQLLNTFFADNTVKLWDAESGVLVKTLAGHKSWIRSLDFSPDGSQIASGSMTDSTRLWSVDSGKEIRSFESRALSLCFSSIGNQIALGGHELEIWNVESGERIRTLRGHSDAVFGVDFSPDGTSLASSSADTTIRIWAADTGNELRVIKGHHEQIQQVSFSTDSSRIVSASLDGTLRLTELSEPDRFQGLGRANIPAMNSCSRVSPDGKTIAFAPGMYLPSEKQKAAVQILDAKSGVQLHSLEGHLAGVMDVCFSKHDRQLASVSGDNHIYIWDLSTGRLLNSFNAMPDARKGSRWLIKSISFSSRCRIAAGSTDGVIRIWDTEDGNARDELKGHSESVNQVSISPDWKTLASASNDNCIRLWNIANGKLIATLEGHSDIVSSVAFDPRGGKLASVSFDGTVKIWDLPNGALRAELLGHVKKAIGDVCYSPDGTRIVTASVHEEVKIWDADTQEELRSFVGRGTGASSLCFSPDGNELIAAVGSKITVWDGSDHPRETLSPPAN